MDRMMKGPKRLSNIGGSDAGGRLVDGSTLSAPPSPVRSRPFSELTDAAGADRAAWVDVLRGVAILLVIVFHVVTVTSGYTGHIFTRAMDFLDAVQGLRMPLLFFLSGLLVDRSLRGGARRYLNGKVARIAYPYFVWSALMVAVYLIGQAALGWTVNVAELAGRVFYSPIDHMWFLAYLFLYYLLALILREIPYLAVLALALVMYAVPVEGQWEVFWRFAVFFFAGALAGRAPAAMDHLVARQSVNWLAIVVVGTIVTLSAVGVPLRLVDAPWNLIIVVWCFAGLAGLIAPWANARVLRSLRFVGRRSVVFYLVHWPVVLVTIRVLAANSALGPWEIALVALVVTSVITTGVSILADRKQWAMGFFELPRAWRVRLP